MIFLKIIKRLEPLGIDMRMWILAKSFKKAVPTLTKIFMGHPYNQIHLPQEGRKQRDDAAFQKEGKKRHEKNGCETNDA